MKANNLCRALVVIGLRYYYVISLLYYYVNIFIISIAGIDIILLQRLLLRRILVNSYWLIDKIPSVFTHVIRAVENFCRMSYVYGIVFFGVGTVRHP